MHCIGGPGSAAEHGGAATMSAISITSPGNEIGGGSGADSEHDHDFGLQDDSEDSADDRRRRGGRQARTLNNGVRTLGRSPSVGLLSSTPDPALITKPFPAEASVLHAYMGPGYRKRGGTRSRRSDSVFFILSAYDYLQFRVQTHRHDYFCD
jgi:hypothetical protein